jgi:serine/threonine-protein kinase
MRFDLLQELGNGTNSTVFKARDRETGAIVALKILPADTDFPQREVLLARKVSHPNVCRVYELFRHEDRPCISMEYLDGETLHTRIERSGALPVDEVLRITRQVLDGLDVAHHEGVVHRDLKPANIMIIRDGTVKLMDFGLARPVNPENTMSVDSAGTPAYMAPEQMFGRADARSDIYALGLPIPRNTFGANVIRHPPHLPNLGVRILHT